MKYKLKKPLKTVLLLQDLEFGGTQRYATHLLKHLNRELFDLELWILRGGEDMLPIAEECNVKVSYFCLNSWVTPRALYRLFWKLRRERPDVIYTLTAVPNIWGRLFSYIVGVPVIVSSWRGRKEQQFESLLWRASNRVVCNAEALRDFVMKRHSVAADRAEVVPNGVDTDHFTPDPDLRSDEPTILYLGRMVKIKDPMTALKAFKILSDRVPEAKMLMIGNGYLQPQLKAYAEQNNIDDRVIIRNGTTDVRPYLRKAWVLTLSSVSEGLPNVILEAMSCGVPVVATSVGGNPEVVTQGVTGLLVPPSDPQKMANAVEKIITDSRLRDSMGEKAREIAVNSYSINAITSLTEKAIINASFDAVERKGRTDLLENQPSFLNQR